MNKFDHLNSLVKNNNGYLFVSEGERAGISRTYIYQYIKEKELEQVAKGIYVTPNTWPDMLYVLQHNNPKIIYTDETALYLNMLMEREYAEICVGIPKGQNGGRLRDRGIIVHQERKDVYGLGVCSIETNFGNPVRVYDKERCICDLVRNRNKHESQTFQAAIKTYMRRKDKDLSRLMTYAERIGIRDEVMKYVEVLV